MRIQEIAQRRSIRKFRPEAAPQEVIRQVLEAARLAPSAKNAQPWRFLVLGPESRRTALGAMEAGLRERMKSGEDAPRQGIAGALHTLRVMKTAPTLILIVRPQGGSPREAIVGSARVGELLDAMSVGAAVENLLLEAQAQGLGTLWIGNTFFVHDELCAALPIGGQLLGAVALGYADEEPDARPRKPVEEIVEFLP